MKNVIAPTWKAHFFQAMYTSVIISVCFYVFVRVLFYEFPMTWLEEIAFFIKIVITGSLFISACRSGVAVLYFLSVRKKPAKKQEKMKLANTLFLRKNRTYVQLPASSN